MFKLSRIIDFFMFIREYKNWQKILAAKLWLKTRKHITVQLRNYDIQFKTYLEGGDIVTLFRDIFIRDFYRLKEFDLKKNSTVIDIGSNIGMFALFAKLFYKDSKVIACEPLRDNFNLLKENIALNRLDNCICHNVAISADSGKKIFILGDTAWTGHLDYSGRIDFKGVMVETLSLEDIFKIDGITRCELLKLDCEGEEYNILFNLKEEMFDRIDNITMEMHTIGEEQLMRKMKFFLANKGYTVSAITNSMGDRLIAKKINKTESNLLKEQIMPENTTKGAYSLHLKRYELASKYCNGKHVLDAACGTGYGSYYLSNIAKYVIGVDLSTEAIDYAKKKYSADNILYKKYNLSECLDFEDGIFDVVCSFETIEHLMDANKFINETARVLKKNGMLILSTNFVKKTNPTPRYSYHYMEYDAKTLEAMLKQVFKNVDICYQHRKDTPLNRLLKRADVFNLRKTLNPSLITKISRFTGNKPFQELSVDDIEISNNICKNALSTIVICKK